MVPAERKALISMKHKEFTFNQFDTSMGQPNFSRFNKWMKVWVAGLIE
jgi:hypothetical protein